MCSATLSLTSSLDGVGGQRHAPLLLPRKETRYPFYGRLTGYLAQSGRVWKIPSSPGFDPRTVQPVTRRYTDYTISAHVVGQITCENFAGIKSVEILVQIII